MGLDSSKGGSLPSLPQMLFRRDPPLQSPVRLNCVHSLNGHSPFLYIGLLYTVPTLPNHILGGLSFVLGQLLVIGSGYRCSVNSQVGEHP